MYDERLNDKLNSQPRNVIASAVELLVRFNGKCSMGIGLSWVLAAIFIADNGREVTACVGAALGWFGWSLEETKAKT